MDIEEFALNCEFLFIIQLIYILPIIRDQELAPVFQFRLHIGTLSWLPEDHRACLSPLLYKHVIYRCRNAEYKDLEIIFDIPNFF